MVGAVGLVHLSIGVARTTPRRFPDVHDPARQRSADPSR
jgi:hypothetical protein